MRTWMILVIGIGLILTGACTYDRSYFEDALPATLADVDRIRYDDDLTGPEKRAALERLGFSSVIINGLLRDEQMANQDGGDLRSAWDKITGGRFGELTPDEIQIYASAAGELDETLPLDLSDEAAQAIMKLFADHDISTADDLQTFLDDPDVQIPEAIPDNALQGIFIDFDAQLLIDSLP